MYAINELLTVLTLASLEPQFLWHATIAAVCRFRSQNRLSCRFTPHFPVLQDEFVVFPRTFRVFCRFPSQNSVYSPHASAA